MLVKGQLKLIDFGIAAFFESNEHPFVYRDSQIGTVSKTIRLNFNHVLSLLNVIVD